MIHLLLPKNMLLLFITMTNKDLEAKIYEFGQVMYRLGRMETDGKDTTKEYNKMVKSREELTKEFDFHFNSSKLDRKITQTLGLI
jgi:hypothetical protein